MTGDSESGEFGVGNEPTMRAALAESKRLRYTFFALAAVLVLGSVGFHLIEGWSLFDGLYMTVITLSTVGYGEIHPLSQMGRVLAMLLILFGVGILTTFIGVLTQNIFERQFFWILERRRMQQTIDKLQGHTIFCGYGRLCRIAAQHFLDSGEKPVILERDERRCEEARQSGLLVVQGDSATDDGLMRAGILRAKRIVSLLPKDADNLYVILTSRELNPNIFVLSRAEDEIGEKRLTRAGANKVLSPYRLGGQKIAEGLLRPYVTDFLDLAVSGAEGSLQIEEIQIPDTSPVAGQTLQDCALRQKTNIIVAAIISKGGEMRFNPSGDTRIEPGSTLIGLGYKKDFISLENLLLGGAHGQQV